MEIKLPKLTKLIEEQIILLLNEKLKNIRNVKDGKDGKDGKNGIDGKDGIDGLRGDTGPAGLRGPQGLTGKDGKDGNLISPQEIIDKIKSLNIDLSDLKEIKDEIKALKRENRNIPIYSGSVGGAGRIVKSYDLSGSLDGSTKTFTLPAFWRIISVHSSSFPNAFRLTTDYTVDGSAMQITFTSAIDAATTLAVGQTVIVLFAEP